MVIVVLYVYLNKDKECSFQYLNREYSGQSLHITFSYQMSNPQ